ncbi:MAG: DUF502 domain-containing protein [Pseudomonadota bacterium]
MAAKPPSAPDKPDAPILPKRSFFGWLRSRFLAGVVIAAPIAITLFVVAGIISWVDGRVKPLIPPAWNPETYVPFGIPGLGVVVAVVLLTLLGAVGSNLIGRSIVRAGDQFLASVPVVRNIYSLFKQLFETLASNQTTSFRDMVLVEYPKRGTWCVGFVTAPLRGEVLEKLGAEMMGVFVPTTPNPTSGFFMFVPRNEVIDLDMTVEDGAKMIVSVGMVVPEHMTKDQIDEVLSKIPVSETDGPSAQIEQAPAN